MNSQVLWCANYILRSNAHFSSSPLHFTPSPLLPPPPLLPPSSPLLPPPSYSPPWPTWAPSRSWWSYHTRPGTWGESMQRRLQRCTHTNVHFSQLNTTNGMSCTTSVTTNVLNVSITSKKSTCISVQYVHTYRYVNICNNTFIML